MATSLLQADRASTSAIEQWAALNVAPTALARRTEGGTEPLLRDALRLGMADWLLAGGGRPHWEAFLPRVAALGRGANDLGFGMAAMVQNLVTGLHLANHAVLPEAVAVTRRARAGEIVVSFAVTEPNVGAHPGKLTTRAVREDGGWRVTGTKTFSTNSFIADEVLIVAVSGEEKGRKRFVALLVPVTAEGFTREEIHFPVCPTATHATLHLNDVFVPDDRRVGDEGEAYLKIVRPFRAYEDLAGAALFLGHLQGLERDALHFPPEARGRLRALLAGLESLLQATGKALDAGSGDEPLRLALPYLLEAAAKVLAEHPSEDPLWQARITDAGMMTLGSNVRKRFYEQLGGGL